MNKEIRKAIKHEELMRKKVSYIYTNMNRIKLALEMNHLDLDDLTMFFFECDVELEDINGAYKLIKDRSKSATAAIDEEVIELLETVLSHAADPDKYIESKCVRDVFMNSAININEVINGIRENTYRGPIKVRIYKNN